MRLLDDVVRLRGCPVALRARESGRVTSHRSRGPDLDSSKRPRSSAWLEEHHATAKEILVGFHKKHTGRASMTWTESVREALCFGWIDGIRRSLGEESYTIRFTPRKPSSIWSVRNVRHVEELIDEGRMTPAGLAAFEARKPSVRASTPSSGGTRASTVSRRSGSGPTPRPGRSSGRSRLTTGRRPSTGSSARSGPRRRSDGSRS